jgi:hypothetical protein
MGGGIHYGIVRKVDGNKVYVEIPSVAPKYAFGPCIMSGVSEVLAIGDSVICGFLNNSASELAVISKVFISSPAPVETIIDGGSA